jgi:hypothetical protein
MWLWQIITFNSGWLSNGGQDCDCRQLLPLWGSERMKNISWLSLLTFGCFSKAFIPTENVLLVLVMMVSTTGSWICSRERLKVGDLCKSYIWLASQKATRGDGHQCWEGKMCAKCLRLMLWPFTDNVIGSWWPASTGLNKRRNLSGPHSTFKEWLWPCFQHEQNVNVIRLPTSQILKMLQGLKRSPRFVTWFL